MSISSPFSAQQLKDFRKSFPHTSQEGIYLNHAAISPLSKQVIDKLRARLDKRSRGRIDIFEQDEEVMETVRSYIGRLLNVSSPDRIGFVQNTSGGINLIASGIQWEEGDHVLINDMEFPANVYPFEKLKKEGVHVEKLQSREGRIDAPMISRAMTPRTRMVSISAVQFLNGFKADLESIGALCKEEEVWFVVDGIQSLGMEVLDVQKSHIDALISGSHKWLMGPQGIGFIYLTEALQEKVVDHHIGWLSVEDPWQLFNTDQPLDPTARRYELGTPNANGIYGLEASVGNLLEVGIDNIGSHIAYLTTLLINRFNEWSEVVLKTPVERTSRAGIVTIDLPEKLDNEEFLNALQEENVTIALRENSLRLSPHYYNTPSEIHKTLKIIRRTLDEQLS